MILFLLSHEIIIKQFSDAESPEVDRFTVQLKKDENGLGITIAGKNHVIINFFNCKTKKC